MNMIKIKREKFLKALEIGGASVSQNKNLPIFGYVKCEVKNNTMTLSSFNGETAIYKNVEVESDEDIVFGVEPNALNQFLSSVKDAELTLEVAYESLSINHDKGSIQIPILTEELSTPDWENEYNVSLNMPTSALHRWIVVSKDFVSQDELRPAMTGMYISVKGDEITVCATDAHKLFMDKMGFPSGQNEGAEAIIPVSSFNAIKKIINDTDIIRMSIGKNTVAFRTEDTKVYCTTIDGKYPNFQAVIPTNNSVNVTLPVKELTNSLKRATISVNKGSFKTKLTFDSNSLSIECKDEDLNKKSIEYLPITNDGNDITIGVNSKNLGLSINAVSGDEINMSMSEPSKPIIVKDNLFPNSLILIMPILL